MTNQYRRVVTGRTAEGKSTVLFDSFLPLTEQDGSGAGARQEDRVGAASSVVWTTQGFPANNDDLSDAGLRNVHTAERDGTVMRIVQYAPGVTPRHHRTDSVDYGVILSGSIEMELDTQTVKLNTGDLLVQRGTVHNWMNNSTKPCLIAYILIGANSVMINGIALPATG